MDDMLLRGQEMLMENTLYIRILGKSQYRSSNRELGGPRVYE